MANVRSVAALLQSFDDFMKNLDWKKPPTSLYLPVEYILSLGGKRIRPMTVLFVTELLNGHRPAAMHAACGLELFHNFSLIHDDIMDNSELRRTKQTVHKKFNINSAILSGDVMMIDSMKFLRHAEKLSDRNGLLDLFIQTAAEVCEGQAMDMEFEQRTEISYSEYLEMIRLKTAVLLAFGLKTGALLSSREDLADTLYEIGIYAGQAFQLEDDWLDFYSSTPEFGKTKAGDLRQGKKSALVLELLEQFNPSLRAEFVNWYKHEKNDEDRILKMNSYFEEFDIREKLKTRMNHYQGKTYAGIENMDLASTQKVLLKDFLTSIFSRNY